MKIVVALNNKYIKEELEKVYKDKVYKYDICDKENVVEFLEKNNDDDITLITKDSLNGNLTGRQYAKQLKSANDKVKIIYIVEKLDSQYKKFLFSNEIINIIEGEVIDIEHIVDIIDSKKFIIYKNIKKGEERIVPNSSEKRLISVYGTSGSGKSVVSSAIVNMLAKNCKQMVALLDMNIENPAADILNSLEVNTNSLGSIAEDFEGVRYDEKNVKDYLFSDSRSRKLSYMTSNINLLEARNERLSSVYRMIINKIKEEYDSSVIDLPSNPFLDVVNYSLTKSSKILFVVNPNYISIRQAIKYLDVITNLYDVSKSDIGIVINKVTENSLDSFQIKSLLKGYDIVMEVKYDKNIESVINGELEEIKLKINSKKLYEFLGLSSKEVYERKMNLINNLLIKNKLSEVSDI